MTPRFPRSAPAGDSRKPGTVLPFRFLIPLLLVTALTAGTAIATDSAAPLPDAPNVLGLLTTPGGGILAITTEKGGVFAATDGGRRWRKSDGVPDEFFLALAAGPDGGLFLASAAGIFRAGQVSGPWERVSDRPTAGLGFSPDGLTAWVHVLGHGLFLVPAAELGPEQGRAALSDKERRADMGRRAKSLQHDLMSRDPKSMTDAERDTYIRQYEEWKTLTRESEAPAAGQASWRPIRFSGLPESTPVQDAVATPEGEWLAATFGRGLFRSQAANDDGWGKATDQPACPWIVAIGRSLGGDVYAATYGGGLFRRPAGQTAWESAGPVLAGAVCQDLVIGADGVVLVATRDRGLVHSPDHGRSWRRAGGLPGTNIHGVAVGSDGAFWAGIWGTGLYVSLDRGRSWNLQPFAHVTHAVQLTATPDGAFYAVMAGLGLFRSGPGPEAGIEWHSVSLPVRPTRSVRLAAGRDGRLYIGSPEDGLWSATGTPAGPGPWEREASGWPGTGILDLAAGPDGAVLAIPADGAGLFLRESGGGWRRIAISDDRGKEYHVTELLILPDGRAAAAGFDDILLSDAAGQWTRHHFGQSSHGLYADARSAVVTERMMSSFLLAPGATEWVDTPDDGLRYRQFRFLGGDRWAGARADGGLDILSGPAANLTPENRVLEGEAVLSLASGPGGILLAGTENGIRRSTDNGRTWQSIDIGLTSGE